MDAIMAKKIKAGDVLVIRYEGPKGGPGMQEMLAPTSALIGQGLGESIGRCTDGRFSGGTWGWSSVTSRRKRTSAAPSRSSRKDSITIDAHRLLLQLNRRRRARAPACLVAGAGTALHAGTSRQVPAPRFDGEPRRNHRRRR